MEPVINVGRTPINFATLHWPDQRRVGFGAEAQHVHRASFSSWPRFRHGGRHGFAVSKPRFMASFTPAIQRQQCGRSVLRCQPGPRRPPVDQPGRHQLPGARDEARQWFYHAIDAEIIGNRIYVLEYSGNQGFGRSHFQRPQQRDGTNSAVRSGAFKFTITRAIPDLSTSPGLQQSSLGQSVRTRPANKIAGAWTWYSSPGMARVIVNLNAPLRTAELVPSRCWGSLEM